MSYWWQVCSLLFASVLCVWQILILTECLLCAGAILGAGDYGGNQGRQDF